MFKQVQWVGFVVASMLIASAGYVVADVPAKPVAKEMPKSAAMDALRGLAGTWEPVGPAKEGMPHGPLVFKTTSGNSAVMETMFPGSDHEMLNLFTLDGEQVVVTHYCAMHNQPHMRLKSFEKNVMSFEFVSGGNIKSVDEPHMHSLEVTIDGDKLVEKWSFFQDAISNGLIVVNSAPPVERLYLPLVKK